MTGACSTHQGERAVCRCGTCGDRLCMSCATPYQRRGLPGALCAHCALETHAAAGRRRWRRRETLVRSTKPFPRLHRRTLRHRPDPAAQG